MFRKPQDISIGSLTFNNHFHFHIGEKAMLDLQATLDKIATIALGNATDPAVKADVEALKAQVAEATAAIAANTSNDQAISDEVGKLNTAFNALVDKLAAAPAPVEPVV